MHAFHSAQNLRGIPEVPNLTYHFFYSCNKIGKFCEYRTYRNNFPFFIPLKFKLLSSEFI